LCCAPPWEWSGDGTGEPGWGEERAKSSSMGAVALIAMERARLNIAWCGSGIEGNVVGRFVMG